MTILLALLVILLLSAAGVAILVGVKKVRGKSSPAWVSLAGRTLIVIAAFSAVFLFWGTVLAGAVTIVKAVLA